MEFSIVRLLCDSENYDIMSLNTESSSIKVNQSEVALLTASLKYKQKGEASGRRFSSVNVNTEQVRHVSIDLFEGYLDRLNRCLYIRAGRLIRCLIFQPSLFNLQLILIVRMLTSQPKAD